MGINIRTKQSIDFVAEDSNSVVEEDSSPSSSVISERDNQGYVEVEGKVFLH